MDTYEQLTDEELVKLFQDNLDMIALGILFERYRDRIHRRVWFYFEDDEDTADIVQDIFLKVHKYLHSFGYKSAFKTWIYRLTINACLDEKRKTAKQVLQPLNDYDEIEDPNNADIESFMEESTEKMEQVDKVLAQMKATDANILLMRYRDEMKPEQIARVFNADVNTIKQRLKRAKGRFSLLYK